MHIQVRGESFAYLKDIPYWATASYPDFQTSVTSQALVAWSLHERNAEIWFPPTDRIRSLGGLGAIVEVTVS